MRFQPAAVASLVLLSAWLGAAVLVAAVVAPAAFAVLPSRSLAGALVGRVLPVVFYGGIAAGLVVTVLGWSSLGPWVRGAGIVLVAASAIAQLGIAPRIAALRDGSSVPIAALDPSDPRRQAFGRLHGLSVAWMGVGMLAAVIGVIVLIRLTTRSTT